MCKPCLNDSLKYKKYVMKVKSKKIKYVFIYVQLAIQRV